jgi:predicted Zn-dependent protease
MNDYVHEVSAEESERIQRFVRNVAIGTILFVAIIILAIVMAPQWVKLISHKAERDFVEPYVGWVTENLLDASDPVLQEYVERLGAEVAESMDVPPDLELRFYVVEGQSVNAFTTLGGHIFVLDSLMVELEDENSLAMVIGHEIAHAVNRDPLSMMGRGILLQIMITSLSGNGGFDPGTTSELGFDLMLNAYSRDQEEDADRLALRALNERYGHVGGATDLFETLQESYGGEEPPELFSSHPDTGDRIAMIRETAKERGWSFAATNPYPHEVSEALRQP